jgi:murein DD-endopeptidase MepM/ murein hydrolase activator NlpD
MMFPFEDVKNSRITSSYGWRMLGTTEYHEGIDIQCLTNKEVHPIIGGTVKSAVSTPLAGKTGEWGKYVRIDSGITSIFYCHLDDVRVAIGDSVMPDTIIGIEGNTGKTTGIHLHLQARNIYGNNFNPSRLMGIVNSAGEIQHASNLLLLKMECGFSDETMKYLANYEYNNELVNKLMGLLPYSVDKNERY